MSLTRYTGDTLKRAALWGGLATIVLCLALGALALLGAAFFLWLERHLGPAAAAALTALALLLLALLVMLAGWLWFLRRPMRPPGPLGGMGGVLPSLVRLAGALVRQNPRRAMVLAVLAGALAEYMSKEEMAKEAPEDR